MEKIEEEIIPKQEERFVEDEPEVVEKFASGPQTADPYAQQDMGQMIIPVLIAVACFLPVLFCLCRL